ncbi:hypothetical protein NL676_028685 [Syzygium grande]|nr:hypothetical protein NL676_028685 [Syzygium grande]
MSSPLSSPSSLASSTRTSWPSDLPPKIGLNSPHHHSDCMCMLAPTCVDPTSTFDPDHLIAPLHQLPTTMRSKCGGETLARKCVEAP